MGVAIWDRRKSPTVDRRQAFRHVRDGAPYPSVVHHGTGSLGELDAGHVVVGRVLVDVLAPGPASDVDLRHAPALGQRVQPMPELMRGHAQRHAGGIRVPETLERRAHAHAAGQEVWIS